MYLGNDTYEIHLSSGNTVTMSKSDFEEFVYQFEKKAFEPHEKIGNHIETAPYNDVYVSGKIQKTITEVKDNAFENLKWDSDLETVLEETIDGALQVARDYYETNYIMIEK